MKVAAWNIEHQRKGRYGKKERQVKTALMGARDRDWVSREIKLDLLQAYSVHLTFLYDIFLLLKSVTYFAHGFATLLSDMLILLSSLHKAILFTGINWHLWLNNLPVLYKSHTYLKLHNQKNMF